MTSKPRTRATQVSIDTRLMQNYRVGSPLPAGTGRGALAAAVDANGALQLFSIGTNDHVFNIFPDASSDTGWNSVDMGTIESHQAVEVVGGTDADGVMFAATIGETDTFPFFVDKIRHTRWNSTWQTVYSQGYALSKLRAAYGIGGAIENTAGSAWIRSMWGPLQFALEYPSLSPDAIIDWAIGKVSTGPCCMVSLNIPSDGLQTFKVWTGPSFSTEGSYLTTIFSRIASTPYPDAEGASAVFLISTDDNGIYYVTSDLSLNQEATTVKISGDVQVEEIAASTDVNGLLEVFALGADHFLYHVRQDPQQPSGWGTIAPISQEMQFGQLAAGKNTQRESELFAVSADHKLHRFWRDRATTNWRREEIDIASTGELEVIHTYTTELTVLDQTRTPCPNTTVTVSSLDPTPALINGRSYWIDEDAPVTCTSDAMGKVVVVVETEFLDAPVLQFATEFMEDSDYIHVQPNASIQDKFSTLTADELLNPTNPNKEPVQILRPPFNTPETAGAVANALNQCGMLLGASAGGWRGAGGSSSHARSKKYLAPGAARRGIVAANKRDARSPRQIDLASVPDQHWEIDYSSGFPVFRQLSREAALARIGLMTTGGRDVRGLFGFDVELGDVLNMATQTVTQITNVIVTTVTENDIVRSIQLAIELAINGITWTFQAVVDLVDQAFALARSVLAKVAASIQDLLDWLENLFQWDQILLTKDALKYTVNQVFTLGEASIACIKRNADDFFDTLKLRAGGSIQQISNMDGIKGRTFQQIRESTPPMPPQYEPSMSYNVVATAYYNGEGDSSGTSAAMALSPEAAAALQDFIDLLVSKSAQLEISEDFQRVLDWFRQMGAQLENDPQAAMQSALTALLELASILAQLTLDLVKAVMDALLNALAGVIAAFKNYLNASWDSEFLVGLYRFATGDKDATLSVLDLLCLILAIPVTVFYKAIKQAPPFADKGSLTAYESQMDTQVALAVQALGPGEAPLADVEGLPAATVEWYVVVRTIAYPFYGFGCAFADAQLATGFGVRGNTVEKNASKVALVSEFVIWATTCPYWYTKRFVKPAFQTAEQTAIAAWLFTQLSLVLDMIAFSLGPESGKIKRPIWSEKKMSLHGDVGTTVSVIEGVIYLVIYVVLAVQEEEETHNLNIEKTIANMFTSIPYVLRLFRYSPIDATLVGKVGKTVLVATDIVFYLTAAILYIFETEGRRDPAALQAAEAHSTA